MSDFLNNTTHTVAWFKRASDARELEMRPPFQRNPVWTTVQKAFLIDTILNGYPIPELYMQEKVDHEGKQKIIVVDGQQRITACLEFLEGQFTLNAADSPAWADMTFDDLSPDERQRIFAYKFVVRLVPDEDEPVLREVFRRLNRNVVALNKQELRHATYWGPFIKCIENLAESDFWVWSTLFSANDFRRMLDEEFISELVVGLLHGLQNKKLALDRWYAVYEQEFEERASVDATFEATLGEIRQTLPDFKDTRWRKKSDFYTLFLLLAEHRLRFPLSTERRRHLGERLRSFSSVVSEFLSLARAEEVSFDEETAMLSMNPSPQEQLAVGIPQEVYLYAQAVQRAASDLGSRRARRENLLRWIGEDFFSDTWTAPLRDQGSDSLLPLPNSQ